MKGDSKERWRGYFACAVWIVLDRDVTINGIPAADFAGEDRKRRAAA